MRIGVLALQGAFIEHERILKKLGADVIEIRKKSDLEHEIDGLVLPGGESTTMGKLLCELELMDPIRNRINEGMPVYGTCAGMILLAKEIINDEKVHLGTMPICVRRNAYGRQLGSFVAKEPFGTESNVKMVFIRAPYIDHIWDETKVLSSVGQHVVAARYKNQLVTSFHPEVTDDTRVHEYFLNMIRLYKK